MTSCAPALLCKADLITNAVVEFTSLQGIMGGHYARFSGETPEVALGITDHYRPRFAGDELPRNLAGTVTAFSDKLDTVCGIFAIGAGPTGSSDPFALRRAAIGIINILLDGLDVSLAKLIDVALDNYRDVVDFDFDEVREQVRAFFATRLEVIARDRGYAPDCIAAVMATGMFEPAETLARIDALQTARNEQPEVFENLATGLHARGKSCRCLPWLAMLTHRSWRHRSLRWPMPLLLPVTRLRLPLRMALILMPSRRLQVCARPSTTSSTPCSSWMTTRPCARCVCVCSTASLPCSPTWPISARWPRSRHVMGDMPTLPTIHVISDSMGNTAKTIARSAASHFGELDPNITVLPYVRSFDQIRSFLEEEQRLHRQMYNDDRIIVYYTLVIQELRDALESYLADHPNIYAVDVLSDSIAVIEQVSGKTHNPAPGEQHKINDQYFQRIEAIEFTVSHDDGLLTQDLPEADIVILGVSRTSKTPTSIYLGQQGYKVANVPLVEGLELPKEVYEVDRERLFGLITDPSVLVGVRKTRMGGQLGQSRYADIDAVTLELDRARTIMRGLGCVIINTKDRAIEETAQEILRHYNAAFPRIPSPHGSFVLPV